MNTGIRAEVTGGRHLDALQELTGIPFVHITTLTENTGDAYRKLGDLLQKADIRMTVSQKRFRMSLAVFNDMNDVDRLLAVLPRSPPA